MSGAADPRFRPRRARHRPSFSLLSTPMTSSMPSQLGRRQLGRVAGALDADPDRVQLLVGRVRGQRRDRLTDAQRDLAKAQSDVSSLLAEIARVRAVIQGEQDLANRRMLSAQADVDAAQRNVDSIMSQILEKESWWDSLPDADWPLEREQGPRRRVVLPDDRRDVHRLRVATAALQTARGILEGIRQGAVFTPIEADPRIAGLYTAYGTATAAATTALARSELSRTSSTCRRSSSTRLVALYAERETAQAALEAAIAALNLTQSGLDVLRPRSGDRRHDGGPGHGAARAEGGRGHSRSDQVRKSPTRSR